MLFNGILLQIYRLPRNLRAIGSKFKTPISMFWSDFLTNGAESQLDNLAFEGQFFLTDALQTQVDPSAIPEPAALPLIMLGLTGFIGRRQR